MVSCAWRLMCRHHGKWQVLHGAEDLRNVHANHQSSHQRNEGKDCVFVNRRTAVAQTQREDPDLCIERPIAFQSQNALPPPDRLHPSQPDSARPCIGRLTAFQSPKNERQFGATGHSNWRKTVVSSGLQRKKFARAKDGLEIIHESSKIRSGFPRR